MNIRDIAKLAGVSSATVSRVVNNSGYVKEETKNKVLRVINEYNYVPNAIARSLSINDSFNIGVIIPDIENEFFSKVISGISEVAEEYAYNIVFLGTNENQKKEYEALKIVESHRLKGVIITPISIFDKFTYEYLHRLKDKGIPVILVDRDIRGNEFDGVFVDNYLAAYDGVQELIKAGHKDIAIITGPKNSLPGRERYRAYIQALKDYELEIEPSYIENGNFKINSAYKCMDKLMNLKKPPTAIFSSNNLTSLGCLKYMNDNNLKIGEDISILGFDNIDALSFIGFKLSVIDRDAKEQGRAAMNLLHKSIINMDLNKNRQEREKVIIPYRVILRGSERRE